jgi:hypothetical protein
MAKTDIFKATDKVVLVITGTGKKKMKVLDPSKMNFYNSSLSTLENTLLSTID